MRVGAKVNVNAWVAIDALTVAPRTLDVENVAESAVVAVLATVTDEALAPAPSEPIATRLGR